MEKNEVYTIKLMSGEEVICRVETSDDGITTLLKPQSIAMNGNGFGMMPWMVSAPNSNVVISDTVIVGAVKTGDMVAKQYIKQTTGIQV